MNKRYWLVILTYGLTQVSAFIGVPLLLILGFQQEQIPGIWSFISFPIGLAIILWLLRPDFRNRQMIRNRSSRGEAVAWSILGVILVFVAQASAAYIEMTVFGIEPGSENTEMIVEVTRAFPAFIIVTSIIGPILEEIVFRMIIFGALYKRFNFWIAALLSSFIFAAVHLDFTHLLVYTAAGFAFAFLYVKTKRILVPIVAHVAINVYVVLVNLVFYDKIMDLQRQLEELQMFIGGLL